MEDLRKWRARGLQHARIAHHRALVIALPNAPLKI
jgi:hypothetical protein